MTKLNSKETEKKFLFTRKKSLVGLTPVDLFLIPYNYSDYISTASSCAANNNTTTSTPLPTL